MWRLKRKTGRIVALSCTRAGVKALVADRSYRWRAAAARYTVDSVSPGVWSAEGDIFYRRRFQEAVEGLGARYGFSSEGVVVSIPLSSCFLTEIELAPTDVGRDRESIRRRAAEALPCGAERVVFDVAAPLSNARNGRRALVIAARRDTIVTIVEELAAHGGFVQAITAGAIARWAMVEAAGGVGPCESLTMLTLEEGDGEISRWREGIPVQAEAIQGHRPSAELVDGESDVTVTLDDHDRGGSPPSRVILQGDPGRVNRALREHPDLATRIISLPSGCRERFFGAQDPDTEQAIRAGAFDDLFGLAELATRGRYAHY